MITDTKQFIKDAFRDVIEDINAQEETYAKYFSKDYTQYVDGNTLDYNDFVAHMKAQKAVLESATVKFVHMVAEDDKVATVHIVNAIKKGGGEIEGKVVALFQIKNEKIVLCDELTYMYKGDEADRDIGSRT